MAMNKHPKPEARQDTAPRMSSRLSPRQPRQDRSRARYEALLDTVEAMLVEQLPEDIGFYQIAERAGMAAASVYHLFPTKGAVFLALAGRYFEQFLNGAVFGEKPASITTWQDYVRERHERAIAFYNANPPAMKLILGAQPFLEITSADSSVNKEVSRRSFEQLSTLFHTPLIENPEQKFLISLSISDAVWRLSFMEHGRITPDYAAQASKAVIAYLRTFLPEDLPLRAPPSGG